MTTNVIFRKWHTSQDVIALFPEEPWSSPDNCTSYEHIGQHGPASPDLIQAHTTPATPAEYEPLRQELVSIGYDDLKIVTRITAAQRRARFEKVYK